MAEKKIQFSPESLLYRFLSKSDLQPISSTKHTNRPSACLPTYVAPKFLRMFTTHTGRGDAGAPVGVGFHGDVGQCRPDQGAQNLPEPVHLSNPTPPNTRTSTIMKVLY